MKSRFTKTLSLMLAVIFCISTLTVPAYAGQFNEQHLC